ncbi:hypothetical protein BBW65_00420 [Helicobacter enhydrae]|uniref:UPF0323 domain-containing protein n=1 Tax=Helicobacter enhydrae TaxID=222136 RepID=A0A1B1U3M6_9HELI|nr:UPF0323 family lipoprotein [Helicobacter enhydrae]ANV97377.1 hypothetical protein BBW65_00420 [Helicobacter enhydrae]
MNKHCRKISDFAMIGGLSAVALIALAGCENNPTPPQNPTSNLETLKKKGAFVILEEQPNGSYKIAEEYPSDHTRVIVRDKNGTERILSQEEIDQLIKAEEVKIDNGTSTLTNAQAQEGGGGLGLGGALLASAAGAILGSYIGNKLFNNPTYQQNQMRNYKSPQAYERSKNSFNSTNKALPAKTSSGKSGFFGGNSTQRSNFGG